MEFSSNYGMGGYILKKVKVLLLVVFLIGIQFLGFRTVADAASMIYNASSINFYSTKYKEVVEIPITYAVNRYSKGLPSEIKPQYKVRREGNTYYIDIQNTRTSIGYFKSFNSLKKSVYMVYDFNNNVNVEVELSDKANLDIYTVKRKNYTSGKNIYYRTNLVLSFTEKQQTKDAGSNQSNSNNSSIQTSPINNAEQANNQTSNFTTGESNQQNNNTNNKTAAIDEKQAKRNILITIDAGHGGKDPGACANGIKEKDLNLDISKRVKSKLEELGYDVFMTRTNDTFVELADRADIANVLKSDLFLSIHNNANGNKSYSGTTVLYNSKALKPAPKLAESMRDSISNSIGTNKLKLENRPNLAVLNSTQVPAVLAEVGVITNSTEASKLKNSSYKDKAASAIVDSINKFFGFTR